MSVTIIENTSWACYGTPIVWEVQFRNIPCREIIDWLEGTFIHPPKLQYYGYSGVFFDTEADAIMAKMRFS